jgi:uncharacterized membrane protein YedE/YeeE
MPSTFILNKADYLRYTISLAVITLLIFFSWWLALHADDGRSLALSLLAGGFFGVVLQRSRFCFFCITREFIDERDSRGLLGIIVALTIGTLGYHIVFSAMLPTPAPGRLPPDAHIGPVSWVLALAALVFGAGMSLSGSCISAHLYRLGEGSVSSIAALIGAIGGFVLGFLTWNTLYLRVIQEAPVVWLPNQLGYGGSLLLQLGLLLAVAIVLMTLHRNKAPEITDFSFRTLLLEQRWPVYVGGLLIGALGVLAYFRVAPLGVTAELGSIARTLGNKADLVPLRLEGLDTFSGCATVIKESILSNNGLFILALVAASFAAAVSAKQFQPKRPRATELLRNFSGGLLMGWGSMTALGCTVGTLLSGIMAAALSGWVFAVFCIIGLWVTWLVRNGLS